MAVALLGLAVALGGSALAATDDFTTSDGVVQACITQTNIVRSASDFVDESTGQAIVPQAQGVIGLVDGMKVLTPKGTVLAVMPGEKCPTGSTPQSLSAPTPVAAATSKPVRLGDETSPLAGVTLPAGDSLVRSTVKIKARGESGVIHTIKCALVGPDGKTIPGTTSQVTIPADSPDERLTIPIEAVVSDMPAGMVSPACKDSAPPEPKSSRTARAAARIGARAAGGVQGVNLIVMVLVAQSVTIAETMPGAVTR
jgi:hypothetical protein